MLVRTKHLIKTHRKKWYNKDDNIQADFIMIFLKVIDSKSLHVEIEMQSLLLVDLPLWEDGEGEKNGLKPTQDICTVPWKVELNKTSLFRDIWLQTKNLTIQ